MRRADYAVARSDSQIFVENRDFRLSHPHSAPPLGGSRRNIAITCGIEKLKWCGYLRVKNFEDTFICFDRISVCPSICPSHVTLSIVIVLKKYFDFAYVN